MGRRKFNAFRDGKVHVMERMCQTCIYRHDSLLGDPRLLTAVRGAIKEDTAVICHDTLDKPCQAVCRGFYEWDSTSPLQIAERLGYIEWQSE